MSIPAGPMELRKKFHRLTHICSIRPQWNFCNDTFSYVRMIHFKPWKPIFQCKFKKTRFWAVFQLKKNEKTRFWTIFIVNSKKVVFGAVFQIWIEKTRFWSWYSNVKNSKNTVLCWFSFLLLEKQLQKRFFLN